jgi:dihydrodipicolinate synthase/N-acetylneuraminate lyase
MDAVEGGRHDEARRVQLRLMPIARSVGALYGVPGLKSAVDACGLVGGAPRPPLRAVPPDAAALIRDQVAALLQPV